MSILPGDITAGELRDVKIKLAEVIGRDSLYPQLRREIPIFNALAMGQSIRIDGDLRSALLDPRNCRGIEMTFLQDCDLEVQECDTDCTIPEGSEPCVETIEIMPNICFEKSIKIKEHECKNAHDYQERLALQTATLLAAMDQELEKRKIAHIDSFTESLEGVDLQGVGGLDETNTVWQIPPVQWTSELIVDLQCVLDDCEFVNPKMIDGNCWKKVRALANAKNCGCAGSCEGHCYDSLLGTIPYVENSRELDKLTKGKYIYLVDCSKIGFFNSHIHTSPTPVWQKDDKNTHHYYMSSPKARWNDNGTVKSVIYDFYWQRFCIAEDLYEVRIKAKFRGGCFAINVGCEEYKGKVAIKIEKANCPTC